MTKLLDIKGLTKRFGPITAVDDVSFSVDRGEVLGFLGPNGAGKSTTMKIVTGFLAPTEGSVEVCGHDVEREPLAIKRRIGYLPEGAPLYGDMTPMALLNFVCDVRRLSAADAKRGIEYAIEKLHIDNVLYQPIETLSKGYKRRVGLAQAIVHDPDVLILDEPTDGLDPNQKHEVRELLTEMAGKKAVIISTHILEEVEAVCSRAIIIAKGKLVADQDPLSLQARSQLHNAVGIRLPVEHVAACTEVLDALPEVRRVQKSVEAAGVVELLAVAANGSEILVQVRSAIDAKGIQVNEIFVERGRLEDVFRDLTFEVEGLKARETDAGEAAHA
ncbi:MAG: ABC transporter ATP-binding protein [Alphaproteobacteria bacterium]|nr:ABC transporter ATP-binding protein [Alphaproteobacteria bacterium]